MCSVEVGLYCQSELTSFFQSFFHSEGRIRMILGVNPTVDEPSPSLSNAEISPLEHALKFDEMTKDVVVLRATSTFSPSTVTSCCTKSSSKRKVDELFYSQVVLLMVARLLIVHRFISWRNDRSKNGKIDEKEMNIVRFCCSMQIETNVRWTFSTWTKEIVEYRTTSIDHRFSVKENNSLTEERMTLSTLPREMLFIVP